MSKPIEIDLTNQGDRAPAFGTALSSADADQAASRLAPDGLQSAGAALLALAERCEATSMPDRELDAAIWWETDRRAFTHRYWQGALGLPRELARMPALDGIGGLGILITAPAYTASLDAAMTLVPEGFELAIYTNWPLTKGFPKDPDGWCTITDDMPRGCWVRPYGLSEDGPTKNIEGMGHSIALAVTAIALRARAASADTRPKDEDPLGASLASGAVGEAETPNG